MEAPLLDAARRGDTAKVRRLLAEGAGIDQIDKYGKSALMLVSIYNHLETASVLLKDGADVNQANRWGFTPMSAACIGGMRFSSTKRKTFSRTTIASSMTMPTIRTSASIVTLFIVKSSAFITANVAMTDAGDVRGSISVSTGVGYERVVGANGFEGVHGHVDSGEPTMVELVFVGDDDHATAFRARTLKRMLISIGSTPASRPWGVAFPQLSYAVEPTRDSTGALFGSKVSFAAMKGPASGSLTAENERRFRSPLQLLFVA
jgi:hypothetical protein